jgi:hypothetical protein
MSQFEFNRLDLLLKEIDDPYVQENFYRLKLYLEQTGFQVGDVINNFKEIIGDADIWTRVAGSVSSSGTSAVDTVSKSIFRTLDYNVTIKDTTSNKVKTLKMTVVQDDSGLKDYVSGIAGSPLNVSIDAIDTGSDVDLSFTNNEAFDVDVDAVRLITN